MPNPLRLLMIEDDENDELLLSRELIRAGYELEYERVCTREDVERACAREWDIAITDWAMPDLSGLDAFRIVHARLPDLPVIMVSGTIGEDVAVSALKAGVDDFMTKGKFARLVPAIERVRRDAATRREKREADKALEQQRQELERSERLLRAVLGSVPDGVLVANHKHELLACNPAARSLLKLTPDDTHFGAVTRSLKFFQNDRITPLGDDGPLLKALGGQTVTGKEIVAKSLDGSESWHFSTSARPLADSSGISAAVVTYRDITQERATHEQLMVSDRMASVGMLAAGVAHEINNPLAAVIANLDLMNEVVTEGAVLRADDVRELLDDARVAADRVRQIVRDLKIFSRHEDGGDGIVDIRHVLESTARMAWNEIRHRARLVKEFADTPPVRGSESRLGQVFLNLLVNAAQAIPEGAAQRNTIRISTRGSDSNVIIEVTDTGSGMSLETQRRLFTPFFTTKQVGEGTGLGLAIAYRIVSALGGTIEVQSELAQGTTFRVSLPTVEMAPVAPSQPMPRAAATRRGRILVIDDEVAMCNVIRRMLSRRHEVHVTSRAVEALDRIRSGETFDIILCDLMMPQMTGVELHAQLAPLGHADRIVFMTGGAFTAASRQFLDSVPNQRLEKPFDARQLEAVVERRLR